jgi:hypothetical protein
MSCHFFLHLSAIFFLVFIVHTDKKMREGRKGRAKRSKGRKEGEEKRKGGKKRGKREKITGREENMEEGQGYGRKE